MTTVIRFTRGLAFPDALKRRLKGTAGMKGLTIEAATIQALEWWCDVQEVNKR